MAELMGTAKRHAQWRELTRAEHDAAVSALAGLAAGRTDLLAEVAGLLAGFSEGELNEPRARQAAQLCVDAGADPELIPAWIAEGRRQAENARMPPHTHI